MHVSRPLLGLLVGTVLFFALWLVALKPGSSTSPSGSQGLGQYQSAIDKAHAAVNLANATSAAHGGKIAAASPQSSRPAAAKPAATVVKPAATVVKPATAVKPATRTAPRPAAGRTSAARLQMVMHALRSGKVLALLFFNAAAADDRAVKRELAAVPGHGRRVVKLAIPISELARYPVVTNQVQVSVSPTLVVIDRRHQAVTLTGFADRFEIAQRVADALPVK
ncbi:MAG: hypothetical protein M3Z06_03195 [Actinomycetota bacterium]|nr:hypothetical protein [Actinomycetota bacterium]